MLGCARCLGTINTEQGHCCYCDPAPMCSTSLGDEIEQLRKKIRELETELAKYKQG